MSSGISRVCMSIEAQRILREIILLFSASSDFTELRSRERPERTQDRTPRATARKMPGTGAKCLTSQAWSWYPPLKLARSVQFVNGDVHLACFWDCGIGHFC